MGMVDGLKDFKPRDNDEKAAFIGEFVAMVKEIKIINSKKTGLDYLIVNTEVINVVSAKEGNTAIEGDEIARIYTVTEPDSMKKFANDMFTAGIELDYSTDEALVSSFPNAVNKLIYFRAWQYKNKDGNTSQSFVVKSKTNITPENSTPKLPF